MKKVPFYPDVIHWWRLMSDGKKINMINLYWGSMYTPQTISSTIIYTTFLFENDNGNVDNVYTRNVIWNEVTQ